MLIPSWIFTTLTIHTFGAPKVYSFGIFNNRPGLPDVVFIQLKISLKPSTTRSEKAKIFILKKTTFVYVLWTITRWKKNKIERVGVGPNMTNLGCGQTCDDGYPQMNPVNFGCILPMCNCHLQLPYCMVNFLCISPWHYYKFWEYEWWYLFLRISF